MSSLYEQLISLRKIPNAFEKWSEYRNKLTEYIITHAVNGGRLLIVGAGACNDFNLKNLQQKFSQVTLMDIDQSAVIAGINNQGADPEIVKAVYCDILGIDAGAYNVLDKMAQALIRVKHFNDDKSCPEMVTLFEKKMDSAFNERTCHSVLNTFGEGSYDLVVCAGVHSQLNNMFCQMAEVYRNYVTFDLDPIYKKASAFNEVIARELNEDLAGVTCGHFILGVEKERTGTSGAVEGAYQAIRDISSDKYIIRDKKEITWPFDNNKEYKMDILSAEKRVR